MATANGGNCPHCKSALTFLEGVSGTTMHPRCPRCRKEVTVAKPTILTADYSRPPRENARSH